jgi:hypothetical protein
MHFECGALPNTKETVLINRESDAVTCIGMYVLLRQHSLDMIKKEDMDVLQTKVSSPYYMLEHIYSIHTLMSVKIFSRGEFE